MGGREKKNTVDYFSHYCKHGKTMFIIEQLYGNDGYAFWFKLLELLGSTEGHFYDCSRIDDWSYLQALTRLSEERCQKIIDKLASLGEIDKELWEKKKIIWSDTFIGYVSIVYQNRKREVPKKPLLKVSIIETPISTVETFISTVENIQSKVEESKEKESKPTNRAREEKTVDNFLDGLDFLVDELYPTGNDGEETPLPADGGSVESSIHPDFTAFWREYPRKAVGNKSKDRAKEAWHELTKRGIPSSDIVSAAKKYALEVSSQKLSEKYIKMPHNFLLQGVFIQYAPAIFSNCPYCKGQGYVEIEREDKSFAMRECGCRKRFNALNLGGCNL